MANVFQVPDRDENLERAVQLVSQGIHSPQDLFRLSEAMKKTDSEKVFRKVCEMRGLDPESTMEQIKAYASLGGLFRQ